MSIVLDPRYKTGIRIPPFVWVMIFVSLATALGWVIVGLPHLSFNSLF